MSCFAQKSSIFCVSLIHQISEPAYDLLFPISEKTASSIASDGTHRFTSVPFTSSRFKYLFILSFAHTVLMIKSK